MKYDDGIMFVSSEKAFFSGYGGWEIIKSLIRMHKVIQQTNFTSAPKSHVMAQSHTHKHTFQLQPSV